MDAKFSNLRSGNDVFYGIGDGSERGTAFEEEYFYHDKAICDRKVVYIRPTTEIRMARNERATGGKQPSGLVIYKTIGISGEAPGAVGKIRYRVDGDLNWSDSWSSKAGNPNPEYTGPFTFATLTYPSNTPIAGNAVLGAVGDNGADITNKAAYFCKGTIDPFSDEWHGIQTASDHADWYKSGYVPPGGDPAVNYYDDEWITSDGMQTLFVTPPKTPCITFEATGDGHFYTTPPKRYHLPQIFAQTTYFQANTGGINITLRNIYGDPISYRINGGTTINVGAAFVTLTAADFANGSSSLEYWYSATPLVKKTRTVVKNPAFPSAVESHGDFFFGSTARYTRWYNQQIPGAKTAYLNGLWPKRWREGDYISRPSWDQYYRTGFRHNISDALQHALLAKAYGVTAAQPGSAQQPFAVYAKQQLLANVRARIDPIGVHMAHGQTQIPSREIIYRGYFDCAPVWDIIAAYDFMISFYKSTDAAGGITAVEDYFIRDCIADFVFECTANKALVHDPDLSVGSVGMWECSRACVGVAGAMVMPSYSTPYYGTSGCDGVTTTTYPWTPYKDDLLTWKKCLIDNDAPVTTYPNLSKRLGIEENLCLPDGRFNDKPAYYGHCSKWMALAASLIIRQNPSKTYPNMVLMINNASNGVLYGTKSPIGPIRRAAPRAYNSSLPSNATIGVPWTLGEPSTSEFSEDKLAAGDAATMFAFYEDDFTGPGVVATPIITPAAGAYEAAVNATITCATAGAAIHYTTNGDTPTGASATYTVPVSIPASATLKAIAVKSLATDSAIASAAYVIDTSGKPAPVLNARMSAA